MKNFQEFINETADPNIKKVEKILQDLPRMDRKILGRGRQPYIRSVDHEKKIVDVFVNMSREARHPEEYGSYGEKMAELGYEWDDEFDKKVGDPLRKLKYKIEMSG